MPVTLIPSSSSFTAKMYLIFCTQLPLGFLYAKSFLRFTHRLTWFRPDSLQPHRKLSLPLKYLRRWQRMPNAVKVGSILFVTPVWNLGWSLVSSSLAVRFCLAATSDSCFFLLHNVSEFGASLSFLPLTYTAQLKTPASKPFIFIYSKFLYISSNEYKADFTAIQNVGAKSIFLACHFVPVTLLYILWWHALLFCQNHCLLFQSPSKPTTLRFQSHWLLGDFSKCICTFFHQGLNMRVLGWLGHMHQRYLSTPSLIHKQYSPMKIRTWSAFGSITGLQD